MFEKLAAPKTEEDITKHWTFVDKIYTSIICITFNQEQYICDAIDSFLAQVTAYKFEVIIHDDVSNDTTRDILKFYQEKYPNIIRLILQDKNQFSININMPFKYALEMAKGEYIALCEGDDFWNDCKKLDLQINALTNLPKVGLCFHPAYVSVSEEIKNIKYNYSTEVKIFTLDDMIYMGGGGCATNSLMIRRSSIHPLPSWYFTAHVGDIYLQIISSITGGALYLPYPMSVYRKLSDGSWTSQNKLDDNSAIDSIYKLKRTHKLLSQSFPCVNTRIINKYFGKRFLEVTLLKLRRLQFKGLRFSFIQSLIHLKFNFFYVLFNIIKNKVKVKN